MLLNIFIDFFNAVYHDFTSFWGLGALIEILQSGQYEKLLSLDGIRAFIYPILPFLLLIEIIRAVIYKRFKIDDYRTPFIIFVFNRFIGRFISIAAIGFCIGLFEKYGIVKTGFTWYWLIYGYIAWEFSHFIYHYLAHKVRLFWCLHSTHHAPESMNLTVSYAHFFLEGPYADVIRTSICLLAGVNVPLLFLIMFIDGTWGTFIHIGDNVMKDGRMGFFNKLMLTPSHHRVHHAKNPLYMDTNFCNLLNIWDKLFGTLQPEQIDVPVAYGITRKVNSQNFWDVYFGEVFLLGRDIKNAPGIKNKFLYIFMPPGWSHTGDHKTAKAIRKKMLEEQRGDDEVTRVA
jgi:sterol desaturase/sphingolipid hydroxylase (fatty acid hydroxylase superfamily)